MKPKKRRPGRPSKRRGITLKIVNSTPQPSTPKVRKDAKLKTGPVVILEDCLRGEEWKEAKMPPKERCSPKVANDCSDFMLKYSELEPEVQEQVLRAIAKYKNDYPKECAALIADIEDSTKDIKVFDGAVANVAAEHNAEYSMEVSMMTDPKLTTLRPVVVLEKCPPVKQRNKGGRPPKKRPGPKPRNNEYPQLRAAMRYRKLHPEVHRLASAKYYRKHHPNAKPYPYANLDVNRQAVA